MKRAALLIVVCILTLGGSNEVKGWNFSNHNTFGHSKYVDTWNYITTESYIVAKYGPAIASATAYRAPWGAEVTRCGRTSAYAKSWRQSLTDRADRSPHYHYNRTYSC